MRRMEALGGGLAYQVSASGAGLVELWLPERLTGELLEWKSAPKGACRTLEIGGLRNPDSPCATGTCSHSTRPWAGGSVPYRLI
jgi:hypothetical protein